MHSLQGLACMQNKSLLTWNEYHLRKSFGHYYWQCHLLFYKKNNAKQFALSLTLSCNQCEKNYHGIFLFRQKLFFSSFFSVENCRRVFCLIHCQVFHKKTWNCSQTIGNDTALLPLFVCLVGYTNNRTAIQPSMKPVLTIPLRSANNCSKDQQMYGREWRIIFGK